MKNLNSKLPVLLIAALLAGAFLTGCGGDTNIKVQGASTISKGQELTDLQRALNEGALTQDEYESVRAKIFKRPN
jgi:hypothetical protein